MIAVILIFVAFKALPAVAQKITGTPGIGCARSDDNRGRPLSVKHTNTPKRRNFMNLKKKIITPFARFFLLLCLIVFFACAGSLDTYRGKTADPNSRIALHGGSHIGVWQTDDLTVKYS